MHQKLRVITIIAMYVLHCWEGIICESEKMRKLRLLKCEIRNCESTCESVYKLPKCSIATGSAVNHSAILSIADCNVMSMRQRPK